VLPEQALESITMGMSIYRCGLSDGYSGEGIIERPQALCPQMVIVVFGQYAEQSLVVVTPRIRVCQCQDVREHPVLNLVDVAEAVG
jgi:hypothetical protein